MRLIITHLIRYTFAECMGLKRVLTSMRLLRLLPTCTANAEVQVSLLGEMLLYFASQSHIIFAARFRTTQVYPHCSSFGSGSVAVHLIHPDPCLQSHSSNHLTSQEVVQARSNCRFQRCPSNRPLCLMSVVLQTQEMQPSVEYQ